jgi:hypothetical protein
VDEAKQQRRLGMIVGLGGNGEHAQLADPLVADQEIDTLFEGACGRLGRADCKLAFRLSTARKSRVVHLPPAKMGDLAPRTRMPMPQRHRDVRAAYETSASESSAISTSMEWAATG